VEENLDLFARMKAGEFPDGRTSAREDRHGARNMKMRDPLLYRSATRRTTAGRRLVPLPDVRLRHPLSDAIEGVTHSICTLEFGTTGRSTTGSSTTSFGARPRQHEFARLNSTTP